MSYALRRLRLLIVSNQIQIKLSFIYVDFKSLHRKLIQAFSSVLQRQRKENIVERDENKQAVAIRLRPVFRSLAVSYSIASEQERQK